MSDLTNQILIDIRNELRETRGEIRGTNSRLDRVVQEQIRHGTAIIALENRLGNAIEGTNARLDTTNARLDNVFIGGMGKTVREHESRIQRVEEHLRLGPLEK